MTDLVNYALNDSVATITMDDGRANALSPDMIEQLNAALDRAEQDQVVVILTGRAGLFCAGFDLKIMGGDDPMAAVNLVASGFKLARRILSFPTPVIVASSGHAMAMGAFLLLSADLRIGLQGNYKTGLNEVMIGMTMPYSGIEIARARLTRRHFNRAVMNAEIFNPGGAEAAGFLDQLVTEDQLVDTAQQAAASMAEQLNMKAFSETKLRAREELFARLDKAAEADSP